MFCYARKEEAFLSHRMPRLFAALPLDGALSLHACFHFAEHMVVTKARFFVFWYKRFKFESCQRGLPISCELRGRRGRPTAGKQLEKMCLIARAPQHGDCAPLEETKRKIMRAAAFTLATDPALAASELDPKVAAAFVLSTCLPAVSISGRAGGFNL